MFTGAGFGDSLGSQDPLSSTGPQALSGHGRSWFLGSEKEMVLQEVNERVILGEKSPWPTGKFCLNVARSSKSAIS